VYMVTENYRNTKASSPKLANNPVDSSRSLEQPTEKPTEKLANKMEFGTPIKLDDIAQGVDGKDAGKPGDIPGALS